MPPPDVFELPRIRMRRPRLADAEAILEYGSNPEVARYADWPVRSDLADTFAAPRSRAPNRIFVSDARVLLARTREHVDLFAALGFSAEMLEALGASIEEFEGMGVQANDTRTGHVEAHAELARIVGDTGDIVAVLDSFNRARFAEESGEMVAWKSVRDIYGPVRRRAEPPGDASSTTPPTTDVARDAA